MATETKHAHHWRIEEPNGTPTVMGRCECGAERAFLAAEPVDGGTSTMKRGRKRAMSKMRRNEGWAEADRLRLIERTGKHIDRI